MVGYSLRYFLIEEMWSRQLYSGTFVAGLSMGVAEYRKYCQRRSHLSFNNIQYVQPAHPRFSSRRSVASASPRLLAMARTLGCLRPSGMFQDFSMRKRSSSVRCDLDLLHFMPSAFLCFVVVSLTVSQKADIFISFFGLARRPPGGGLRGAFFALLDASLHFASIVQLSDHAKKHFAVEDYSCIML